MTDTPADAKRTMMERGIINGDVGKLLGEMESTDYELYDGAVKFGDTWDWAATVKDPTEPNPKFAFLRHCPGGFVSPGFTVGDVIAWGGTKQGKWVGHERPNTDSKGYLIKKYGPYYRLIVAITPECVRVVKCGYETARRLRKELLASPPSAPNPFASFSDEEIRAEFVRRGLRAEFKAEAVVSAR
jgi:hypothetical protein